MSKAREQPKSFSPDFLIRNATTADIDAVYEIAIAGRLESWSREAYLKYTARENSIFLVAELAGKICGFAVVGIFPSAKEAEIHNVAVAPDSRRQGIGSALLAEAERRLLENGIDNLFLEVRESNTAAISVYKNSGFEIIGRRPEFYKNPAEDAFVMRKSLQERKL
jgi:ribosomal-protein-alanine N-acetyltransferase